MGNNHSRTRLYDLPSRNLSLPPIRTTVTVILRFWKLHLKLQSGESPWTQDSSVVSGCKQRGHVSSGAKGPGVS